MICSGFRHPWDRHSNRGLRSLATGLTLLLAVCSVLNVWGQTVSTQPKHVIGATATLTEVSTGMPFSARIDTGAKSCSMHVEKIEIKEESPKRWKNKGKNIRMLVKGENGKTEWIETTIASAIRVKSSSLKDGEYDRRYKVRLTFQWQDFRKEVLVSLNDRTNMEYPLLIGRNFLRGDFVVDVEKNQKD